MENKNTMVVHDTLRAALNLLSSSDAYKELMEGVFDYGFTGSEPEFKSTELKLAWLLYKPAIDANTKRYNKAVESGKKSAGNRNPKKVITETKINETTPTITKEDKVQQEASNEVKNGKYNKLQHINFIKLKIDGGGLSKSNGDYLINRIETGEELTKEEINETIKHYI